jgi:hypothetical protein
MDGELLLQLVDELDEVTREVAVFLRAGDYKGAIEVAIDHSETLDTTVDNALVSVIMTMATYRAGKT